MLVAVSHIPATFSFGILFTLIAILTVSGRIFYILTQQWTTRRPISALNEWARERQFKLLSPPIALPASLRALEKLDPQIEMLLIRGPVTLARLTTASRPAAARPTWHLIIRDTSLAQNPAGLRPAMAGSSFLDLFSLIGFPSILPPDRFVVFAAEASDARRLAATSARGLLPADIGLMIHGPYLTLDFSTRPFDVIEFDRMLSILEQIAQSR